MSSVARVDARWSPPLASALPAPKPPSSPAQDEALRDAFQDFVGQTLFGQMLRQMRKTVPKVPYFHGGRAEDIFQQQLDQLLAEKISDACADRLSDPMFALFLQGRR